VKSLVAAVLLLVSSLGLRARVGAQQTTPSAVAGRQAFLVQLTPVSQASPTGPASSCSGIALPRLQFLLDAQAGTPTITIAPELTAPFAARTDKQALVPAGSGFHFDRASVAAAPNQIELSNGSFHLTAADSSGAAASLTIDSLHLALQRVTGDVVMTCQTDVSGTGTQDTTFPTILFPNPCSTSDPGCALLADGAVTVAFSKPVVLSDVAALITAIDDSGAPIKLFDTASDPNGYWFSAHGAWPLGNTVHLRLGPGIHDVAGNTSNAIAEAQFAVVADPGDLDRANDSGFELSDLTGYTISGASNHEQLSAVYKPEDFASLQPSAISILTEFHGIAPTENASMLTAGESNGSCSGTMTVLTSRFVVPFGATTLVLDDNAVTTPSGRTISSNPSQGTILRASVRGEDGTTVAEQGWRDLEDIVFSDDGTIQTGWRRVRVNVGGFAGQTVVLTLRLHTETLSGPLLPCYTSVILVDNLHFE
jgi:hypothetical protein